MRPTRSRTVSTGKLGIVISHIQFGSIWFGLAGFGVSLKEDNFKRFSNEFSICLMILIYDLARILQRFD